MLLCFESTAFYCVWAHEKASFIKNLDQDSALEYSLAPPRNVSQGSALQSLAQEEPAEVQSLTKRRDFCTRAVHQSKRQKQPSRKETGNSQSTGFSVLSGKTILKDFLDQPFLKFYTTENASDVTSYLFPAVYYFCLPSWELWGQQIQKIQR